MTATASETFHILLPGEERGTASALEVALELRLGVPAEAIDAVRERTGLNLSEILQVLSVSNSTLKRRRQRSERLPLEVADALFRLLHVFQSAEDVLGTRDQARTWLVTPNRALNHHRPLDLLASTVGTRIVEDELSALDHGFLA